jgi:hypothetical protein
MSSINGNSGHFDQLNSSIIPLDSESLFIGSFSSCLNFAVIDVSVKCDSSYNLKINYSHDGVTEDYSEVYDVSGIISDTTFYRFDPKMRYYRIKLTNTDSVSQTVLILQTLLKSTNTYVVTPSSSDVNIVSPLNLDGSVKIGGEVDVSGNVYDGSSLKVVQAGSFQTTTVWNNEATSPGDVSQPVGGVYPVSNITVYGYSSSNAVIALQFAIDNESAYYTSQYLYTISGAGDFGFALAGCCAPVVRLVVISGSPTLTVHITIA